MEGIQDVPERLMKISLPVYFTATYSDSHEELSNKITITISRTSHNLRKLCQTVIHEGNLTNFNNIQ